MNLPASDLLLIARGGRHVCGCGRPLLPRLGADGAKIGVTHTPDDDDHHLAFFGGITIERTNDDPAHDQSAT